MQRRDGITNQQQQQEQEQQQSKSRGMVVNLLVKTYTCIRHIPRLDFIFDLTESAILNGLVNPAVKCMDMAQIPRRSVADLIGGPVDWTQLCPSICISAVVGFVGRLCVPTLLQQLKDPPPPYDLCKSMMIPFVLTCVLTMLPVLQRKKNTNGKSLIWSTYLCLVLIAIVDRLVLVYNGIYDYQSFLQLFLVTSVQGYLIQIYQQGLNGDVLVEMFPDVVLFICPPLLYQLVLFVFFEFFLDRSSFQFYLSVATFCISFVFAPVFEYLLQEGALPRKFQSHFLFSSLQTLSHIYTCCC